MNLESTIIVLLFFLTAILYTSVGFGGGSTYLAILIATNFDYQHIPALSLLCNIVAVTNGCFIFAMHGFLSWKRIAPFLILSIPTAFLGALIPIPKTVFLTLVAISLTLAAFRMLFLKHTHQGTPRKLSGKKSLIFGLFVGAVLGLLAGMTGLGGGIFLAPVLHLTHWENAKVIAAATSVFILFNSVAGLMGQLIKNSFVPDWQVIAPLVVAVLVGSQIGARLSSLHWGSGVLQRLTAVLIMFVSARIFWQMF